MTVQWFGENWGAPICTPERECAMGLVVAQECGMCEVPITPADQGVRIPHLWRQAVDFSVPDTGARVMAYEYVPYHLDCFLKWIGLRKAGE